MGDVLDDSCAVHGVEALHVVDAASFPTITPETPHLTAVMLGSATTMQGVSWSDAGPGSKVGASATVAVVASLPHLPRQDRSTSAEGLTNWGQQLR